ncbi:MAG: nuclear transport factor 2 family protein [Hyphomicrobiales bacterium]|nr:nuclear transport factor 2 family protein [Hyphomicrobiales bacterium]
MTKAKDIVDRYLAIWNETDPARRRALMADLWAADARYADPVMQADGRDGIETMIAAAQARFPGHVFCALGEPEAHDGGMRFRWTLAPKDGPTIVEGTDFAVAGADGRLVSVAGFFDRLPSQ